MKKYISVFIITALLVSMFTGFGATALAEGEATINLSTNSVTVNEGEAVDITASFTNNTGERFTDYQIRIKDTNTTFGGGAPLAEGDTQSDISIHFTPSQTDTDVVFIAEYKTADSSDWKQGGSATVRINKKAVTASIKCTAKASQTLVAKGDIVTFTFDIENRGDVAIDNIEVKAAKLNKGNALNEKFSLSPGQSHKVTYKHTFATPITVESYISYTVNGSAAQRYDIPEKFEIKEETRDVDAILSADDSTPDPGQEVTFKLKIANNGNVPYTNLVVTWNGEKMSFPTTQLNEGESFEKEYKMSFDASTDVKFIITMKDQKGQTKPVNTNTIKILLPVDPSALQNGLKLVIEVDRNELTSAGVINFSGYIANDSEYTLSEVSVTEASLGEIFAVSEMAGGTKQSISKTADINETSAYTFTLSVKDRNEQVYTVTSDPITVTIQGVDTVTDNPIEGAPTVTLPPEGTASDPLGLWFTIAIVLVVLIIGVGVALVILWRNGRSPSASRSSMSRPSSPPRSRKPVRGGYGKAPIKSRSYRDRNNF